MKKIALLFSACAVASTALAATPVQYQRNAVAHAALPAVEKAGLIAAPTAKVPVAGAVASKKVIKKEVAEMTLGYEAPYAFALGLSKELQGFKHTYLTMGAYNNLTFKNTSVNAAEWEWEYLDPFNMGQDPNYLYTSAQDLTVQYPWSIISAPALYGVDSEGDEDSYTLNPDDFNILCGGGGSSLESGYDFGSTTYTYFYNHVDANSYSIFGSMMYAPGEDGFADNGLDPVYTNPEDDEENPGLGLTGSKFVGYGNYFAKQSQPYYMSKIWCWMNIQTKKATSVDMTFYKVNEDGEMTGEILAAGSCNVSAPTAAGKVLEFDMYAVDEDGLPTEDPIVVDCDFMAVMSFNVNDIAQVAAVSGIGAQYEVGESNPYVRHAYMVLDVDGENTYLRCPYAYYTDNSRKTLMAVADWMWMIDATMPFIGEMNQEYEKVADVEGGNVVFNMDAWWDLTSCGFEAPEWVDLGSSSISQDSQTGAQVLTLAVDALPEGETGRYGEVKIYGIASECTLYIGQGEFSGVETVTVANGTTFFDLSGRRVANPEKGLYIKVQDGKASKVVL